MSDNGNRHQAEIECLDLYKTYRMGQVDVPVLKGVNLKIYSGELTVILGASGSGKSTLLNIIGGIDRPTSGRIICGGKDLTELSDRQLTEHRRQRVGFVFQFYNLVPTLTALENVMVSTQVIEEHLDPVRALELVELADHQDYFPAQLSGGQQQRVSIARALAKKPRVMLCDEPTGALDFKTGQLVLGLLTKLNQELKATIIIVTHSSTIARLARRIIHITSQGITIKENETPSRAEDISW